MNCLKHRYNFAKMFPWTHGESISIPVHNAPLPLCCGKEISNNLIQPQTFIRNDQPYAFESTFFQVTQEIAPGFFVFTAAFRNAEYFTVSLIVHSDRNQNRNVLNLTAPTSFQIDSIHENVWMLSMNRLHTPFFDLPVYLLI